MVKRAVRRPAASPRSVPSFGPLFDHLLHRFFKRMRRWFLPIVFGVACVRAAPRRALPLQLLPLLTRPGPAQHGPTRMPARPKRPDSDAGPPKTARLGCRPQTSATSGRAVTGGPRRGPVALPARRSRPPVGRPSCTPAARASAAAGRTGPLVTRIAVSAESPGPRGLGQWCRARPAQSGPGCYWPAVWRPPPGFGWLRVCGSRARRVAPGLCSSQNRGLRPEASEQSAL